MKTIISYIQIQLKLQCHSYFFLAEMTLTISHIFSVTGWKLDATDE